MCCGYLWRTDPIDAASKKEKSLITLGALVGKKKDFFASPMEPE